MTFNFLLFGSYLDKLRSGSFRGVSDAQDVQYEVAKVSLRLGKKCRNNVFVFVSTVHIPCLPNVYKH